MKKKLGDDVYMAKETLDGYEAEETESRFEEVDYDEISDKLDKTFDTTTGKPVFENNTPAQIKGLQINRGNTPQTDSKDQEYYPMTIRITTQTKDGIESHDNYGGIREYSDRMWNSDKSAIGRLITLAQEEDNKIDSYRKLFQFLPGKKVKIRTETTNYQGQEYKKNMIQAFI